MFMATFGTVCVIPFRDFCHNSKFMHAYACPFNIYEHATVDAHEAEAVCCRMCATLFMVVNVRQFIYQMHMHVRKLTWPSVYLIVNVCMWDVWRHAGILDFNFICELQLYILHANRCIQVYLCVWVRSVLNTHLWSCI